MLRLIYYLWELKIIHNSDSSRFYRNVICAILKLTLKDDTTSFVSPSTYGPKILCSRTLSVAWFLNKKYLTLFNAKLKMHHLINYEISSVLMWSRKKKANSFFSFGLHVFKTCAWNGIRNLYATLNKRSKIYIGMMWLVQM